MQKNLLKGKLRELCHNLGILANLGSIKTFQYLLTDYREDYRRPVAHNGRTGNDTKDDIFYRTWSLRFESNLGRERHHVTNT